MLKIVSVNRNKKGLKKKKKKKCGGSYTWSKYLLQLNGKIKRENYGKRKKNGEDPEKEQKGKKKMKNFTKRKNRWRKVNSKLNI